MSFPHLLFEFLEPGLLPADEGIQLAGQGILGVQDLFELQQAGVDIRLYIAQDGQTDRQCQKVAWNRKEFSVRSCNRQRQRTERVADLPVCCENTPPSTH